LMGWTLIFAAELDSAGIKQRCCRENQQTRWAYKTRVVRSP
jgi:hypothetical protein